MPAETLFARAGDCDSLSILLVGLVRAAQIAAGCVIVIDDVGGGHAMAAFAVDPRAKKDWAVSVKLRGGAGERTTFTVVETTGAGWRLGGVASEYQGRYVRLDAIG
jgi:transglutaminase-like putative cysteine protease